MRSGRPPGPRRGRAAPLSAQSPRGVAFGRRNHRGATLVARTYLFIFKQGGRPSPFNSKLETSRGLVPKGARPLPAILHLRTSLLSELHRSNLSARPCSTLASRSAAQHAVKAGAGLEASVSPPQHTPTPGALRNFFFFLLMTSNCQARRVGAALHRSARSWFSECSRCKPGGPKGREEHTPGFPALQPSLCKEKQVAFGAKALAPPLIFMEIRRAG